MRVPSWPDLHRLSLRCCGAALLCAFWGNGWASLLDVPATAAIAADQPFELALTGSAQSPLRVQLERSPVGLELVQQGETSWVLRWNAPDRRFPSTVQLSAAPRDNLRERERYEIQLLPDANSTADAGSAPAPSASAGLQLPAFATQSVPAGRPFSLWVKPQGRPAEQRAIAIALRGAPDGATVEPADDGWHKVILAPMRTGSLEFEVIATAVDDPLLEARQRVRLEIVEPGTVKPQLPPAPPPVQVELDEAPATAREQAVADAVADPDVELERLLEAPTLRAPSNHIVSAGRAVRFRVRPEVAEGQRAIVQIDRLPRNASFDEKADGSRSFHWPTGDRDQGEHRFRLTAINAEDASLRHTREVTVIVGDPTRGKTAPAQ